MYYLLGYFCNNINMSTKLEHHIFQTITDFQKSVVEALSLNMRYV